MYPAGKDILVIDGDPVRRQLCERLLSEEGFAVTSVSEGFSAIRAAADHHFALAIVALQLPGSPDGVTALELIRARQPKLKALFTAAAGRRPHWAHRDRDDFIAFPFEGRELLGCVFELLQRDSAPYRGYGRTGLPGLVSQSL